MESSSSEPSNPSTANLASEPRNTQMGRSYRTVLSSVGSTLISSIKWCPTSEQELANTESDLLSCLKRPFRTYFVDIGKGWGKDSNKIRTIEMNNPLKENKQPLVLVHGFGAGIGMWILNLDELSIMLDRKIYAFDLIGFARSSRATFDLNGDVEQQFVDSIERWRERQNIDKFIFLGHSFGGYLGASYALTHPQRVTHLILADPWGFQDRQLSQHRTYKFPLWVRAVNSIFQSFNPLAIVRVTGPYGPRLVHKFRTDLKEKFRPKLGDDCYKFLNYIYHCNAQEATGETAFKSLALPFGWPKNPMINRIVELNPSISMTFIYGSRSWIERTPGEFLKECLTPYRVALHVIQGSGHHVYGDKPAEFNELVREACNKIKT